MIAWTDERRRVVLEERAGVEVAIPRSRVPLVIEVLGIGQVQRRRRAAAERRIELPAWLLDGSEALRREAVALMERQTAQIGAAHDENRKWTRMVRVWTDNQE